MFSWVFGGKKSRDQLCHSGGSSTINKHRMAGEAAARLERKKSDMAALEAQKASLDA
jgi:hypothetical protein